MDALTCEETGLTMEKIQSLIEGTLQAVTTDMVDEIASKVVSMIEVADDIVQPETIELMRKLPEASQSLGATLDKVKRLEESGALDTLFKLGEMINSMKASMTGPMITDMAEKTIQGVEIADDLVQKGSLELVTGMIMSFQSAVQKRKGRDPMSVFRIIRSFSDPELREGVGLLLEFLKQIPKKCSSI